MNLTTPWDDHYMRPAFLGCVSWALQEPGMQKQFEEKTGRRLGLPRRAPIEQMIDKAAGFDPAQEILQAFIDWVADDIFGRPGDELDDIELPAPPNATVPKMRQM